VSQTHNEDGSPHRTDEFPEQAPPKPEDFIFATELGEAIGEYLGDRPWREVDHLIHALQDYYRRIAALKEIK
jgi:hypothetical protein